MIKERWKQIGRRLWTSAAALAVAWGSLGTVPALAEKGYTLGDEEKQVYEKLLAGKRVEIESAAAAAVVPDGPTVYLTFDDGPSRLTPKVLDILEREGVPATFFVLGELAEKDPEMVRRIVEEGHALGSHSYNHVYKELYESFDGLWEQLRRTDRVLLEATGQYPALFRAPGGTFTNFDAFYFYYVEQAGYRIADWNVDSGDASRRGVPASEILRKVKESPLSREVTVLMHDGTGHDETVRALPAIIAYYKEHGYTFGTLDESPQPVRFRLGSVKWDRPADRTEQFAARLAAAQAYRQERLGADGAPPAVPAGAEGEGYVRPAGERPGGLIVPVTGAGYSPAPAGQPETQKGRPEALGAENGPPPIKAGVPLVVRTGDAVWELPAASYEFEQGRFAVPLEQLAARLGASLSWQKDHRAAEVRLGNRVVIVDPGTHTLEVRIDGQPAKVYRLADVKWKDGKVYAGLRMMTEALGWQVAGYSLSPDGYRVDLEEGAAPWEGRLLPIWPTASGSPAKSAGYTV
ncbi:hypothetical protein J31TS4_43990 [Paenibacillus sp. J31TS4]|uniref:polysaccharide deacetylase n=1 Tax=Paenibacillus sp. J31TS4 TaxID=2807195 RepID=UPI001B07EBA6|nr:polysaccharide deacetylase [Paenibacillus sp. J31TS4]GIP41119.1 hypothetical protein J31TS4_43990 [Paenibacillus sp. J31TS4]